MLLGSGAKRRASDVRTNVFYDFPLMGSLAMDEPGYALSPHWPIHLTGEKIALLARANRGWAVLTLPDYARLLAFFDATPAELSKQQRCDPNKAHALDGLYKSGIIERNGQASLTYR